MALRILAASLTLLLATPAMAQEGHAGHAGHERPDKLGKVAFANSCAAAVQEDLTRAVAMLHSFWYSAAEPAFRDVLVQDPACGVATWGIAAILMNNPLAGVGAGPSGAEQAQAAIEQGRRIGAGTQRERDYIEAVGAYYRDFTTRPEQARQQSRAEAFTALAARYPDDDEAQIFSALYIAGTQSQAEQTFAAYRKAAAILEPDVRPSYPDHPGVAHYLIHVYDAPPLAAEGETAAARATPPLRRTRRMRCTCHRTSSPGSAPGRSRWRPTAVHTKRRSKAVNSARPIMPAITPCTPTCRWRATPTLLRDMANAFDVKVGAATAVHRRLPVRRHAGALRRWSAAIGRPPPPLAPPNAGPPYTEAITWFARALGAARTGDVTAAETGHVGGCRPRRRRWSRQGTPTGRREVEVQQRAATAWTALPGDGTEEALTLMRQAADLED